MSIASVFVHQDSEQQSSNSKQADMPKIKASSLQHFQARGLILNHLNKYYRADRMHSMHTHITFMNINEHGPIFIRVFVRI